MKSHVLVITKKGCPACEHTKPVLAAAGKKIPIREIDADSHPDVVRAVGATGFPDITYHAANGTVHRMPWKGIPKAADIVRWASKIGGSTKKKTTTAKTTTAAATCAQCGGSSGVSPKEWGPPVWFVIHILALMYPRRPTPQDRAAMKDFFAGLQEKLPCEECRRHFAAELARMPASVYNSRDSLFAWTVKFHDAVSRRTHSTQPRHTLRYWRRYYKHIAGLKETQAMFHKHVFVGNS